MKDIRLSRLIEQRDRFVNQMEALRNQVAGLELAIALLSEEEPTQRRPVEAASGGESDNVSDLLRVLLQDAGARGINARLAVELAARRGVDLNRSSVSSLLSRMKRDGKLSYQSKRYILKEFAP